MFEIIWSIDHSEWERAKKAREEHAPGSEYDSQRLPLYYLLNGEFDVRSTDGQLYRDGGPVSISLLDFANFAATVVHGGYATNKTVVFDQLDDDRHITFDFSTPLVRVSANDSEVTLEVARDHLMMGLKRFLVSLAHAIDERATRLFDWRCLTTLAPYRSA
jgi:hypothetical protein